MKNTKYTLLFFLLITLTFCKLGYSQNAPGGNVSNATSFINALGGHAFSTYQAGVHTVYVTKHIQLAAPITITNGFFKLIPADTTCILSPAIAMNRLITVQTGANLTIQGVQGESENENAYLIFKGTLSEQVKCNQNIFYNTGTLIVTSFVIIEDHNGSNATIHNEGTIGFYGGLIRNNSSTGNGGVIYHHSGYVTLDSVVFQNNSAPLGSAIYQNSNSFLLLNETNLNGGTLYLSDNATISVNDLFHTNGAISLQKGIYTPCTPLVTFLGELPTEIYAHVESSFQLIGIPTNYSLGLANDSSALMLNGTVATMNLRTCESYYFAPTDSNYTQTTSFVYPFETSTLCDSLVLVNIEIKPFLDTVSLSLCSYDFPYIAEGQSLTAPGTYQFEYSAIDGCDSIITYFLDMIPTIVDSQYVQVCDIALPYLFEDSTIQTTGEYIFEYSCGSATHFFFEVFPTYRDTLVVNICESAAPYQFDPQHIYSVSGEHTFSYVTENGCDSIVTLQLTIYPNFEAQIVGDSIICENETAQFTAVGSTHFSWNTGATTATIEPTSSGIYSVTVTDALGCYQSIVSKSLAINAIPQLGINELDTFCEYDSITIIPSNADFYIWNGLDTANQYVAYNHDPVYLQAFNANGCFVMDTIYPQMNPAPTYTITGDFEICFGDTAQIEITSGYSYLWSTGATTPNIELYPSATTQYYVTITTDQNCSYVDSVTVQVHSLPEIQILGDTTSCEGIPVTLIASGGTLFVWSNLVENDTVVINQTGIYSVTGTNQFGCISEKQVMVTLFVNPTLSISGDTEICEGESSILSVMSDAPFVWSTGATLNTIEVNPIQTTLYSVTATTSEGCIAVDSIAVIVYPAPDSEIIAPDQFCSNTSAQITATGGATYLWSTGATSPAISVATGGTYSVTISSSFGCNTLLSKNISTIPAPQILITGDSVKCTGQSTQFTASGGLTYMWSNGSTQSTATVTTAGLYSVTATGSNGCVASKAINFIQSEPNIVITGDTSICMGETTILTASGGSSYLWSNGQTSPSVFLSPVQTSFYYVTVTNSLGCSSIKLVTLIVNPLPSVTIMGENTICQGDLTTLTANGGSSYLWSNGSSTASVYVSTSGFYTVTATNVQGCSNTATTSVTVKVKPNVSILGTPSFCQGGSTTLTATGGASYVWSNGFNTQNTTVNLPGTYSVTVTSSNGCTAVASVVVIMNDKPSPSIIGDRAFCSNSQTILTAMGGGTYLWNDGTPSQSITVTAAGTYTVTVTNQNGCTASVSANTTVYAVPTPSISGSNEFCQGLSLNLIASGGATYSWSTGATSTFINVTQTGTYVVTATDTRGCTAEATKTVIAHPLPVITITGDTNICTGGSTFLVANVNGGTSYVWSTSQTTPFINVTPTISTNYTVIVTNVNGCSNSVTTRVHVRPFPTATITGNTAFCNGDSTTITAQGGTTYLWNNNITEPSLTLHESGIYTVTVTSQYGCSSTTSANIIKNSLPIPTITGAGTICEGQNGALTASGGVSYQWSNNVSTATINPATAGTYTVTVTNANGCSAVASTNITVNSPPLVNIIGDTSFCQGSSIILAATGTENVSYLWSNSSSGSSISVNLPGVYSVTATHLNGCTAIANKTVTSKNLPSPQITGGLSPCLGKGTTLTASGGASYIWSNGNTNGSITINPSVSSTYYVTVTDTNGCSASTSVVVSPLPLPSAAITGGAPICEGNTATLTATGGNSYVWSTGMNGAVITATVAGTYTVTVTNSLGCTATSSVSLIVNPNPNSQIIGSSSVCEGSSIQLEATGGISYLWSNNATTSTINVNPTSSTSYSCSVTNNYGCQIVVSKPINVNPLPQPQLFGGNQFCDGTSLVLTAAGGNSYIWDSGDTTAQLTVSTAGLYSVTVTLNGCTASTFTYVTNYPNPIPTITEPVSICQGLSTTLSADGGVFYHWSNESNNSSITVSSGGVYTVTVTNSNGCTASISSSVTLLPSPQISISGDLEICNGTSTLLIAHGGGSYLWNTSGTDSTLSISPTSNTQYSVTVTNSFGCSASTSTTVVVRPVYLVNRVAEICQGTSYFGQGFSVPTQNVAGTFEFFNNLTTINGCDSIIKLTLTVNPKPVITQSISGSSVININGNYTYIISNTQHATSYEWSISNPTWVLSNSTTQSVNLAINNPGIGTLSVYGVNECGVSTPATLNIQSTVEIKESNSEDKIDIFPNPVNSVVTILNRSSQSLTHLVIYDITGKYIDKYELNQEANTINVESLSTGVYILKIYENTQIVKQQN
jgi:hypothetical protein